MWHNIMRSTKSQIVSVLHYNIDIDEWLALVVHMQFEKSNLTFYTWRDQRPHKIKYKMKKKQQEEKLKDKLTKTR